MIAGWITIVVNEDMPRYFASGDDWNILSEMIEEIKPGLVLIDSCSRLHTGSIEDSKVAKELMKNLRELANHHKVTLIVIHHTHKLYNTSLSINTIAGSRIIAQDADFMIGLSKTLDNKRYIKDVAFRYAPDDSETVKTFIIEDDLWLKVTGETEEAKLLSAFDGRKDDLNGEKIYDYLADKGETNGGIAPVSELEAQFVKTGVMSQVTLFSQLKKLLFEKRISKVERGEYKAIL
jgi:hypothetical protein